MNKTTTSIELSHVTKQYILHHEKPTLAEKIVHNKTERFLALKDINLVIKKGERVGIIGPNGSGKTTLLKIIAGITTPTSGTVHIEGKIVSLIDLGAGFHPDLTGEQNIILQGTILGMTKNEIRQKEKDIIRFAGIGNFIDAPLFTYSEGMKLRLGFSVAAYLNPDILILDEGLSTGDIDFQKKSVDKIREFFKLGKTIVVASHWLEFLQANCRRIINLEKGTIKSDGPVQTITTYQHLHRK